MGGVLRSVGEACEKSVGSALELYDNWGKCSLIVGKCF